MHCLLAAAFLLCIAFQGISGQDRFRSILIQRACARRPTLDFCEDFKVVPPPVPAKDIKHVALVTPPQLTPVPKSTEQKEKLLSQSEEDLENSELIEPSEHTIPKTVDTTASEEATTETRGNLIRLPKPSHSKVDEPSVASQETEHNKEEVTKKEGPESSNSSHPTVEDKSSVLVFVSEYCVIERERFVRNCHGESVLKTEIPFCQTYPSACSATPGVIPVISYCQRYYSKYPKYCTAEHINEGYTQFCYAFEQFCLPELTPAQPASSTVSETTTTVPKSSLKRCEDIVDEARKVCNPFPNPRDTFNVIRCSQFLTNCKKFVDWA